MILRVGRKQRRAVLDEKGVEVALFHKGHERLAMNFCEWNNEREMYKAAYEVEKALTCDYCRANGIISRWKTVESLEYHKTRCKFKKI